MTESQKTTASFEAEMFGKEIGYAFMNFDRCDIMGQYSAEYLNGFEDNPDAAHCAAQVVRCPHCQEIQVCWGEFGDPETEVCICTQCGHNYETEPF
jgi:hypothetical protein